MALRGAQPARQGYRVKGRASARGQRFLRAQSVVMGPQMKGARQDEWATVLTGAAGSHRATDGRGEPGGWGHG